MVKGDQRSISLTWTNVNGTQYRLSKCSTPSLSSRNMLSHPVYMISHAETANIRSRELVSYRTSERKLNNPGTSALKPRANGIDLIPALIAPCSPLPLRCSQHRRREKLLFRLCWRVGWHGVHWLFLYRNGAALDSQLRRTSYGRLGGGRVFELHGIEQGGAVVITRPCASSSTADGKKCHGYGVEILL